MPTLEQHTNNVLAEFASVIPENLLAFETTARAFVRVRALELQKLGISDTNKTVIEDTLDVTARDGAMPVKYVSGTTSLLPAWVELKPLSSTNYRKFVEIVPLSKIAEYEHKNAIAFYGTPMRYKLAADLWKYGTIQLYYDPIEDWDVVTLSTEIVFPPNFTIMLELKTAAMVAPNILLNLAVNMPSEYTDDQCKKIEKAVAAFVGRKERELAEWEEQMRIWRNKDLNEVPIQRGTWTEIKSRSYKNINRGYWNFNGD